MTRQPSRRRPEAATAAIIGLAIAISPAATTPAAAGGSGGSPPRASTAAGVTVRAPIALRHITVGGSPNDVAIDSPLRTAWVAAGRLVRISERTQRVVARITTHPGVNRVAVDPRRHLAWATACFARCTIVEVSEATNRILHRVAGPHVVSGIAVDPRTGLVWLAALDALDRPTALAISEATRRVVRTIRLHFDIHHQLGPITVDPGTGTVWASVIPGDPSTSLAWVSQISESARRVVHVYARDDSNVTSVITAVDSRRGTAWLEWGPFRESAGVIEVVSIARHRVLRTIFAAPVAPEGLAIDPRTGIVVATRGVGGGAQNSVVLLKESTGALIRQVRVGLYPAQLAVDPATGNVYAPIVFRGVVAEFHE